MRRRLEVVISQDVGCRWRVIRGFTVFVEDDSLEVVRTGTKTFKPNRVFTVDGDKRVVTFCRNRNLVVGNAGDVNLVVSFIEVRDNVVALTACVDEGISCLTTCAEVDVVVACACVNRDARAQPKSCR